MAPEPTNTTIESLLAHASWLDALARRLVSDPNEADEIVQETWVTALSQPPRHTAQLRAWMARVARNLAVDRGRSERARKEREQSIARTEASTADRDALDRARTLRRLVDAVLALDEPYRSTIVLHYFERMSIAEVAVRQAVPESTVRTRMWRAIGTLRERFRHEEGDAWSAAFLPLLSRAHPAPLTAATTLSTTTLIGGIAMATAWKIGVSVAAGVLIAWWWWPSHVAPVVGLGAIATSEPSKEHLAATDPTTQNPREPLSAAESATSPDAPSAPLANAHTTSSLDVHVRWGDDNTPASGVVVGLWQVGAPDPFDNQREGRADEHGHAHFDNVFVGDVVVNGDRGGQDKVAVHAGAPAVAEIVIPDGMDVEGTVVDELGNPVSDARIWISGYFNDTHGHEVERSDGGGRFHLRDVGEARYLAALHDGYGPSEQHLIEPHPAGAHVEQNLVLTRSATAITGVVLDEAGRPVRGADVELRPQRHSSTDESGRATWPTFPPVHRVTEVSGTFAARDMGDGAVRITVRARGHAPVMTFASDEADGRTPIEVRLEPEACVHGFVRNGAGAPVGDVLVCSTVYGDPMSSQTWTRSDGSYRLEQLPALPTQVHVDARGGGEDSHRFDLTAGADVEWNVTLRPNASVKGRVTDAEDKPLAGWLVLAKTTGNVNAKNQSAYTAEDGSFTVGNWPDGADALEVREPDTLLGEPAVLMRGVKAGDENVAIKVQPENLRSAFITGRVLDTAGQPLADTQVIWSSALTHYGMMVPTNEAGRFSVGPLRSGVYELEVDVKGQAPKQVHEIHLAPKQELDVGDVQIERSGVLVVHVHLPPRAAPDTFLPSITVHRIGSEDDAAMSLKDGEGRLAGLLPGEYLVHSEQADWRIRARANVSVDQTTTMEVDAVPSTGRSVRFMLPAGSPPNAFVKMRLFDASGNDVYDYERNIHDVAEPVFLSGLVVGKYRVEARLGDGPTITTSFAVTSLEPETVPIEMRLN